MSQTERLYWIDAQIRSGRFPNAAAVCAHFEVSERTAYADRDHLKMRLGAPLCFDRRRGGWVYTDTTYVLPFLAFSEREAATLQRSLLAAQEYLGSAEAEAVRQLAARLCPYVAPLSGPAPESVGGSIHLTRDVSVSKDLLDDTRQAIRGRNRLHLLYHGASRDVTTDRVVQPYHVIYWRGEQHLVAYCERAQGIRQFFLGRVREWTLLAPDGAFVPDPSFDLADYLKRGFGIRHGEALVTVRVRFSSYQARWVRERRYHESQQTEELPDGGLLLSVEVAGTFEVKRWLLGYGAEAEVLEPASLRAELAAEAKKLAGIYG